MKPAARFQNFEEYAPIEPFEVLSARLGIPLSDIVKLDANENPYGACQAAQFAMANLAFPHIYPDPESRELRSALSRFTDVPIENLMVGAGADELIDLILRVMLDPQDAVINFPPTFGMYDFNTRLNNGQVINVARRDDFSIDLQASEKALLTSNAKVVFAANPNNPDGSILSTKVLDEMLSWPALIVIDEAYIEFSADNHTEWLTKSLISKVPDHENLVVLRTFSKWAGLAGLRVGYGAFPIWLIKVLWRAKQPYNVNVAATKAAIASLLSLTELEANIQRIRANRLSFGKQLSGIGYLQPLPSEGNFILVKLLNRNSEKLQNFLIERGIFIRRYKTEALRGYIRISIGTPADMQKLVQALEDWK